MINFKIRKAIEKDIPELQRLQKVGHLETASGQIFEHNWFIPYIEKGITLVAESDGKIAGYIMGEYLLLNGVMGWFIVVDPDFRGTKIAKTLLTEFKRIAKENGATWMIAYAVKATVPAHEKMGAFIDKHDLKEILYEL